MTDQQTPPDWVLIEAAKRCGWETQDVDFWRECYGMAHHDPYRALCDMIERIEQQAAEIAKLQQELVDMEPIPYCQVCGSCGEVGCGCTHKCKFAFDHPDVEAKINELDNRAMDLLLMSDKQAAHIEALTAENERLRAALGKVRFLAQVNYEQNDNLNSRGRRDLWRIAQCASAALGDTQ